MWKIIISLFILLQFSYADREFTKKSKKALDAIVKNQIEKLSILANSTKSSNSKNVKGYVLSSHIQTFSDIENNVKNEIDTMRYNIKTLIIRIASEIEVKNDSSGRLSIDEEGNVNYFSNKKLPEDINDKQENLLKANLKNSISVRSIELAVRLLANINSELINQGKSAKTKKQKEKIYMKQAVYVYEMSDMLLDLLNEIGLEGAKVIYSIYAETKNKVDNRLIEINEQKKKVDILVEKNFMSQSIGVKEKDSLALIQQANKKSLEVWDDILAKVGSQEKFLAHLKEQTELIAYKKENARLQLATLRDMRVIGEVKNTIGSLDKLVDSVSNLELLVLDKHTVKQLLGISE